MSGSSNITNPASDQNASSGIADKGKGKAPAQHYNEDISMGEDDDDSEEDENEEAEVLDLLLRSNLSSQTNRTFRQMKVLSIADPAPVPAILFLVLTSLSKLQVNQR
jgi:hypothetical protein